MQSGGLCSLCKNDLGQVTSPPQAPGRSSATQQRSCHPMRAGGVNDICKAEAGPRGGPRYWEREEPKRPRPPGRRMQRTPHSQPNPQSQRRTPGSGWEAGCPDFACLLGREQPGPVRMERGKQMKSYIDRGQGAHHRSLGGRRRGRRMGPGREPGLDIFRCSRPGSSRPQGNAFVHRSTALAFVCCPPTPSSAPGSPSLPSTPTPPGALRIVPADSPPLDAPGLSWTLGFSRGRPYRSGQHRPGGRGRLAGAPSVLGQTPRSEPLCAN